MKVSDVKVEQAKAADLYKVSSKQQISNASGAESLRPDEVNISSRAVEMSAATEKAMRVDEIDKEKVATIKEQVQTRTYKISPEELSQRILENLFYFGGEE